MDTNVLLVVFDAARRDAFEPYGARAGSTPAVAELARRGRALPLAYATSSWTLPSHASMFTGLLPRRLGVGQAPSGTPEGARSVLASARDRMLPVVLGAAGYATHGYSANLWASGHAGFGVGFERSTYVAGGRNERMEALLGGGRRARLAWANEGLRARSDDGAAEIGAALRRAISEWSGRPTFWFANLIEAHAPYLPPRPWNDLGPVGRVRGALEIQRRLGFESICLHAAGHASTSEPTLARMRHLYDRAVSYMDAWLADVLEALDRRGILDQTLVIVTSDHGEMFGEHGLIAHGFSVAEPLIHVPLVLAGPGAERAPDHAFSHAALPALIADACGLRDHPWSETDVPERIAISYYDAIGAPEHPQIQAFASRWGLDDDAVARLTASYASATDGVHKLVRRDTTELRYDLGADPGERAPLGDAVDERFAPLRAALDRASAAGEIEVPAAEAATSALEDDEVAELERQMRMLGYM